MNTHMAKCALCGGPAEPNPADTENGPHPRDLADVYCEPCIQAYAEDDRLTQQAFMALGFPWYHHYDLQRLL